MKGVPPVLILLLALLSGSCSINKLVIHKISDALTGTGSSGVFLEDTDPELVGDAVPFAIKMYETLLDQNPGHPGLILTTGSLFIMYANAFVQGPAEMLPVENYEEKRVQMDRAKRLYLRGTAILEQGIENKYPGLLSAAAISGEGLAKIKKEDVALFYWEAAGSLSAFALNPFDLALGMRIPRISALMARCYELDPDFNGGALDDFYLLFYASLPEGMGGDPERAEIHYQKALEKSRGRSAGPYVSYAQAVAVPAQNYEVFKSNLEAALAIDPSEDGSNALANIISQRKARYLLEKAPELFANFNDFGDESYDDDYNYYY
ncbi:MAG: TRAP transporter TatT component family protein [Treponema sp.]|jgi:predicted anti-sigma-YlaC factor YlaD|nr:TRAP transporter TatT component family protein [Treponema sp.]